MDKSNYILIEKKDRINDKNVYIDKKRNNFTFLLNEK